MTVHLSDNQMQAVHAVGDDKSNWEVYEIEDANPVIPSWFCDVHVDWMFGYGNTPSIRILAKQHLSDWDGKEFEKREDLYIAEHPDGRCVAHYHNGALTPAVGAATKGARPLYQTTKQQGYGGRSFFCPMKDGTMVELRGPWHGPQPSGYTEVIWVTEEEISQRMGHYPNRDWWEIGGTFGACFKSDQLIAIIHKLYPDIKFAKVHHPWGTRIEPYLASWGMPKTFVYKVEQRKAIKHEPAGPGYQTFWGPKTPMYGIEK